MNEIILISIWAGCFVSNGVLVTIFKGHPRSKRRQQEINHAEIMLWVLGLIPISFFITLSFVILCLVEENIAFKKKSSKKGINKAKGVIGGNDSE